MALVKKKISDPSITEVTDATGFKAFGIQSGENVKIDLGEQLDEKADLVDGLIPENQIPALPMAIYSFSTSFTVALIHNESMIEVSEDITVTLPNGLPDGFKFDLMNIGTGTITLSALTTLTTKENKNKIAIQYGGASIYHAGSNVWRAVGDLSA